METISGSYPSILSSFETDYTGNFINNIYTSSKDFSNQLSIKLNDFSGLKPLASIPVV